MELYNIKPYKEHNYFAVMLMLYYVILRAEAKSFLYTSFFDQYFNIEKDINQAITSGSISYDSGSLFVTSFLKIVLSLINDSYKKIEKIAEDTKGEQRAFKSDHIEQTILYELSTLFSKDDIKTYYPNVSDSTIMRVLTKLKEEGKIIALSKGRSAQWRRTFDKNDIKAFIGGDYED